MTVLTHDDFNCILIRRHRETRCARSHSVFLSVLKMETNTFINACLNNISINVNFKHVVLRLSFKPSLHGVAIWQQFIYLQVFDRQ